MKIIKNYTNFINENNQQVEIAQDSAISNKINKIIDYTIIKSDTIKDKVKEAIEEAINKKYYGIVVMPDLVDFAKFELKEHDIKVISTLDFPNGNMKRIEKLNECIKIISNGADEIDMCINIKEFQKAYNQDDEELKTSSYISIEKDIKEIANECHRNGVILKVIVESGSLTLEELKDICTIVVNGNVDFIQTSSGTGEIGAELSKIKEMRRLLPDSVKIKAAGGIRNLKDANEFYTFVDRIGTSITLK